MICRCPNCSTALVFNPEIRCMECKACGSIFDPKQFEETQVAEDAIVDSNTYQETGSDIPKEHYQAINQSNMMKCNIYTCTACGAELMVNGVETSTFCAYCGQPTIVFSRVSSELQPDCILPFHITKDSAVGILRTRFNKGFFVPDDVKNFQIDTLRGIYIPFWLYDFHYYDKQYWTGTVKRGKSTVRKYYLREAQCDFHNLSVDASYALNDEMSQRLEPFDYRDLQNFDVDFLSGFYADRYDMDKKKMWGVAKNRAHECFSEEVKKSISASSRKILQCNPQIQIQRVSYALLPAWFLTFRYKGEIYTMLINGQTGKVIGSVPVDKSKITVCAVVLALVFTFIAIIICISILLNMLGMSSDSSEGTMKLLGFFTIVSIIEIVIGFGAINSFKKNIALTKEKTAQRFVKNRQEVQ